MFSAAGKGERRNLRGSARLSSKMSGKLPRLRALRPRQQRMKPHIVTDDMTRGKPEGNLKAVTNEETIDVKKCDSRRIVEDAKMIELNELDIDRHGDDDDDDGDDDDENEDENEDEDTLTMTAIATEEDEEIIPEGDVNVDIDVTVKSEEMNDLQTYEQTSYECKNCEPSKTLPNIEAYLEHLRKEHKQKVRILFFPSKFFFKFCALVFVFPLFFVFFHIAVFQTEDTHSCRDSVLKIEKYSTTLNYHACAGKVVFIVVRYFVVAAF